METPIPKGLLWGPENPEEGRGIAGPHMFPTVCVCMSTVLRDFMPELRFQECTGPDSDVEEHVSIREETVRSKDMG